MILYYENVVYKIFIIQEVRKMKTKKKFFATLALVMALLITAFVPASQITAKAATKTKTYSMSGISFKIPTKYEYQSSFSNDSMKTFVNTSDSTVIMLMSLDGTLGLKNISKSDLKEALGSTGAYTDDSGAKISNVKKKKLGKFHALMCDYEASSVKERMYIVDNTDKNKTVILAGVTYSNSSKAVLNDVTKISKTAKKKK